jgi:hypothetical protein
MKRFELIIILFWIAVNGLAIATTVNNTQRQELNQRAFVQAVCDTSHAVINGNLEKRCSDAQDKTNTEYLCTTNTPQAKCWTEVK